MGRPSGETRASGAGIPSARRISDRPTGSRTTRNASPETPQRGRVAARRSIRSGRFSRAPVYIHGPGGRAEARASKPSGYVDPSIRTVGATARRSRSANRSMAEGFSPARRAEWAALRALAPRIRRSIGGFRGLRGAGAFALDGPSCRPSKDRPGRRGAGPRSRGHVRCASHAHEAVGMPTGDRARSRTMDGDYFLTTSILVGSIIILPSFSEVVPVTLTFLLLEQKPADLWASLATLLSGSM